MPAQSKDANRRKVGRTVTYYSATRKPRPAVITALSSNGGVVLRVGRHDASATAGVQYETYGDATTGVPRRAVRTATSVWDVK